ncbi:toll/interleukin-1 receptor domain-containing protein [candidate division KSB1 bacterium]|nr:toll/interleukin-1 receptor domain-containing protein [candidate division KSB1 bacterium]
MKVFISHSHKDEILAKEIATFLKKAGLDVWEGLDIFPGDNWASKVSDALNESNAMVVLLTPESIKSRSVRHDIEFALGHKRYNKRLLPVIVGQKKDILDENVPWILKKIRHVNLDQSDFDEEDLNEIVDALMDVNPGTSSEKKF